MVSVPKIIAHRHNAGEGDPRAEQGESQDSHQGQSLAGCLSRDEGRAPPGEGATVVKNEGFSMKISFRTKKGFIPQNKDKINQDSFIIAPSLNQRQWLHFFSVCDGHGQNGHLISHYLKQ